MKRSRSAPSGLRVAVLASGNGTNFQALQDACAGGYAPAEIACVLTNKREARVVEREQLRRESRRSSSATGIAIPKRWTP
jgi:folate-dependent phosphoribosylglycinamide formyltransferase PurN